MFVFQETIHFMDKANMFIISDHCRCNLVDLMVEMDRILRPEGTVVIRDSPEVIDKVARVAHAVRWSATIHEKEPESGGREKILVATKTFWKLH